MAWGAELLKYQHIISFFIIPLIIVTNIARRNAMLITLDGLNGRCSTFDKQKDKQCQRKVNIKIKVNVREKLITNLTLTAHKLL